jgi:ketosteroid isomerase-like protein
MPGDWTDDHRAIKAIIERQFGSLNWRPGTSGDWAAFATDFHPEALLFAAARPAKAQTVATFIDRMKGLAGGPLQTFGERVLGTQIHVFGNIAVALAGCEITENGEKVTRGVEALLLVKDDGAWRIVAQNWDVEREGVSLPRALAEQERAGLSVPPN